MPTLKEVRAGRLLTLRALAERAGVAVSTVHLIETGKSVPRFGVIQKLSAALDIEPQEVTEFAAAIEEIASGKARAAVPTYAGAAASRGTTVRTRA